VICERGAEEARQNSDRGRESFRWISSMGERIVVL
jgi:hypothetical protein